MSQLTDGLLLGNETIVDLYNSSGHRCKELEKINLRNHFVVLGDTAGISAHLPIEETFPHILSQKLKIDYYNLSVANGGVDAMKYNLFTWIRKIAKPKVIIVACEFNNAVMMSDDDLSSIAIADLNDPDVKELMNYGNLSGFFNARNFMFDQLLYYANNIPVYHLSWKNKLPAATNKVTDITCEGLSQYEIANILSDSISSKFQKAKAL